MDDDVAYYRILEFIILSSLLGGVSAECLGDEVLKDGVCECIAGRDCSRTPFHNHEI